MILLCCPFHLFSGLSKLSANPFASCDLNVFWYLHFLVPMRVEMVAPLFRLFPHRTTTKAEEKQTKELGRKERKERFDYQTRLVVVHLLSSFTTDLDTRRLRSRSES